MAKGKTPGKNGAGRAFKGTQTVRSGRGYAMRAANSPRVTKAGLRAARSAGIKGPEAASAAASSGAGGAG